MQRHQAAPVLHVVQQVLLGTIGKLRHVPETEVQYDDLVRVQFARLENAGVLAHFDVELAAVLQLLTHQRSGFTPGCAGTSWPVTSRQGIFSAATLTPDVSDSSPNPKAASGSICHNAWEVSPSKTMKQLSSGIRRSPSLRDCRGHTPVQRAASWHRGALPPAEAACAASRCGSRPAETGSAGSQGAVGSTPLPSSRSPSTVQSATATYRTL